MEGKATGHLKLLPATLLHSCVLVTTLVTFFHPSFLPLSAVERRYTPHGENFCTHVFRVSHRRGALLNRDPPARVPTSRESSPANQVFGDTRVREQVSPASVRCMPVR